jgi:hypothetical protein
LIDNAHPSDSLLRTEISITSKHYLVSLPERVFRSLFGMGAGMVRETAAVALPDGVRRSQLYQNLVDATLLYVITQVGGVETDAGGGSRPPEDFLARRTAGNAIELLGIVAFRASPVWVLAALADISGLGRHLIPEIADALKAQGLLDKDAEFTNVDQLLNGLEQTSAVLAAAINTPPLDVAGLRSEWEILRERARGLQPADFPSGDTIRAVWTQLRKESEEQGRSIFETSSLIAVSAARAIPDGVRWVSASARVGARRTGQVFADALLDHYRDTLSEIRRAGYVAYARQQLTPYIRASIGQFSPQRPTLTQRLIEKLPFIRSQERRQPR